MNSRAAYSAGLVKVYRQIGIAKKPRKRLPRQISPKSIERMYAREILKVVQETKEALQPLLNEVPELVHTASLDRRLDAGEGSRVRNLGDQARNKLRNSITSSHLEEVTQRFGQITSSYQKEQLNRQIRAALGTDVIGREGPIRSVLEGFVSMNVSKIKSLPEQIISGVESTILDGVQKGRLGKDLAKDLAKRFNIEERRAKRIARDQIGTLYGQLNATRQKDIGIKEFIWRTSGNPPDERTREEHQDRNGVKYSYDDPPDGELPGEPINCRCYGEPVFDAILGEAGVPENQMPVPEQVRRDQAHSLLDVLNGYRIDGGPGSGPQCKPGSTSKNCGGGGGGGEHGSKILGKHKDPPIKGAFKKSPFIGVKTQEQVNKKFEELKESGVLSSKGLAKLEKQHAKQINKLNKIQEKKEAKKTGKIPTKSEQPKTEVPKSVLPPGWNQSPVNPFQAAGKSATQSDTPAERIELKPEVSKPSLSSGKTISATPLESHEAAELRSKAYDGPPPATEKEVASVRRYTGSNYRSINKALRSGDRKSSSVKHIDSMIEKSVVDRTMAVYRGFSSDAIQGLGEGDIFQDHGYVSTSSSLDVASGFSGYNGVVMHIEIPKGARALSPQSQHAHEKEIILPRSSKFEILSISKQETQYSYASATKTIVHARVIYDD